MSFGVVLTDGVDTVDLRDRPIHCYDWSDLLSAPPKRGRNRVVPGVRGTAVRPRVAGELRALLHVRVFGDDHEGCVDNLATLFDLLDVDGLLDVTVHRGGLASLTGELQVEDPDTPTFRSDRIAELVVDVTVPAGRLT